MSPSPPETQEKGAPPAAPAARAGLRLAARLGSLAALWWALSPEDPRSWVVGAPVVLFSAWAATRLAAPGALRVRLLEAPRFVLFFLRGSILGGADVAFRALHPRMPIEPGLLRHPLSLPEGTARRFFITVVNLLPGTLASDLEGSTLVIHLIDDSPATARGVSALERRVAALFAAAPAEEGAP